MVYASARDDHDWYLQLQVNDTVEWVTAAHRDEAFTVDGLDLLLCTIRGFNGQQALRAATGSASVDDVRQAAERYPE